MKLACVMHLLICMDKLNWLILAGLMIALWCIDGHCESVRRTVRVPDISTIKVIRGVADEQGIDVNDLLKIAFIESSFKADARRVNTNGSIDVGMFQVNSVHWNDACRGIDVFTLKGNATCAAILYKKALKHCESDLSCKGRYHSKTPTRKRAYAAKIASIDLFF